MKQNSHGTPIRQESTKKHKKIREEEHGLDLKDQEKSKVKRSNLSAKTGKHILERKGVLGFEGNYQKQVEESDPERIV